MREKVDGPLIVAEEQYKYNYEQRARETPDFRTNVLVFLYRLPLA